MYYNKVAIHSKCIDIHCMQRPPTPPPTPLETRGWAPLLPLLSL